METFFEFIFELIFEIIFEGTISLSKNKKVSNWIRIPIIIILFLLAAALFGIILMVGLDLICTNTSLVGGIIIVIASFVYLFAVIRTIRKEYLKSKNKS